jgi:O-antigen ligase
MSGTPSLSGGASARRFAVDLGALQSWLLAAIFFCIPIQVAPAYILSAVLLVVWLVDGRLDAKLRDLAAEPLVWIFVGYHAVLLVSILWTADTAWGWRMVGRQNFFLLFVLYLSVARPEHFGRYVSAFLLSTAMCESLAFYNWAQMNWLSGWPAGVRVDKSPLDSAPFVDRILYAPALAFAGYLAGHRLVFEARRAGERLMYAVLLVATGANLAISGGRAGAIGFFALLALLIMQRFAHRPVRAALAATAIVAAVFVLGYHTSSYFEQRVDDAVAEIEAPGPATGASVRARLVYAQNAWQIFEQHPWFGVGIGDYRAEYERVNAVRSPEWPAAWNPHNQYLYVLTAAGLPGGVMLALVLLVPLLRRGPADGRERIRKALPVLFLVICLSESYLFRSNTSLMYALFSAAAWSGTRCNAS